MNTKIQASYTLFYTFIFSNFLKRKGAPPHHYLLTAWESRHQQFTIMETGNIERLEFFYVPN